MKNTRKKNIKKRFKKNSKEKKKIASCYQGIQKFFIGKSN